MNADVLALARVTDYGRTGRSREIRQRAGRSLADIAAALAVVPGETPVSATTVMRWELGHRRPQMTARSLAYARLIIALEREQRRTDRLVAA